VCQLSIYNSFPVIRTTIAKNRHFYVPGLHFLFALGTPLRQSRKTLHEWKDNSLEFSACQTPHSMYPSILNSFPVIRTASAKIAVFTYRSPHFCFSWRRPCDYHAICCMDGKTIQCLPNPRSICLSVFNSFYTMLKSTRKSKNFYFYHIFVSPGDAPGAITLNVVWVEREFDAHKLSRYMCPSNYNCFWDRARYLSKIVIISYPLAFDAPVRGLPSE